MIRYNYTKRKRATGEVFTEREPYHYILMQNPNTYIGQLGAKNSPLWLNTAKVYNVNSCIYKADGNFLNEFFFQQIGKLPIFLGSYPKDEKDCYMLKQSGITAVMNLFDPDDIVNRSSNMEGRQMMMR